MRFSTTAIVVCAVVGLAGPAAPSCISSFEVTSAAGPGNDERTFLWTAEIFTPLYFGLDYDPLGYTPPFTADLRASFWELGQGDPAIGAGSDSGAFNVVQDGLGFPPSGPFPGFYYASRLFLDWADPSTDGCPPVGTDACICLLLEDVDPGGRAAYLAAVAANSDAAAAEVSFALAGTDADGHRAPIVLRPVPGPGVTTPGTLPAPNTLEIAVTMPQALGAVYEAESGAGCDCAPVGYQVYSRVVTATSDWLPPADRDPTAWTLAPAAGGGPQGVTPMGQPVTVQVDCPDPANDRAFFAARLRFDSGFESAFLSANSLAVACDDAGIALPDPLSRRHGTARLPLRGK